MNTIRNTLIRYLDTEDLLYIEIYMKNGMNFRINEPKREEGIKIKAETKFLRIYGNIYGDVDGNKKIDTCIPYDNISYVSAGFGLEEIVSNQEE